MQPARVFTSSDARRGCVPVARRGFSGHLPVQRGKERVAFDHRWKQARCLQKTSQLKIVFMISLSFPFTEEKIRALKVGDEVLISGLVFTGREMRG